MRWTYDQADHSDLGSGGAAESTIPYTFFRSLRFPGCVGNIVRREEQSAGGRWFVCAIMPRIMPLSIRDGAQL